MKILQLTIIHFSKENYLKKSNFFFEDIFNESTLLTVDFAGLIFYFYKQNISLENNISTKNKRKIVKRI